MNDEIVFPRAIQIDYSTSYSDLKPEFAAKFLAAILSSANNRGVLPNPEMMAKEAVKYADALIKELSK